MNPKPVMPCCGRDDEDRLGAEAVDEPAADQCDEKTGDRTGQQIDDAGLEHGRSEAVSRCLVRDLDELRQAEKSEVQSHADEDGGEIGEQYRASAQHLRRHQRLLGPSLPEPPADHDGDADGCARQGSRRHPAPGVALGDRQQHRGQSGAEACGAEPVDRTRRAARAGGHHDDHDRDHDDGEGGGEPEDAVVVGAVVHQQADDHQPGSATEAQRCGEHRHRRTHAVFGELLAQVSRRRRDRARMRPPAERDPRSEGPETMWWPRAPNPPARWRAPTTARASCCAGRRGGRSAAWPRRRRAGSR